MKFSSKELKNIDLHDSTLRSISINIFKKKCVIEVALWSEENDGYRCIELEFLEVSSFDIKEGLYEIIFHDEILEFDFKRLSNTNEYKFIVYNNDSKTIKTIVLNANNIKSKWII